MFNIAFTHCVIGRHSATCVLQPNKACLNYSAVHTDLYTSPTSVLPTDANAFQVSSAVPGRPCMENIPSSHVAVSLTCFLGVFWPFTHIFVCELRAKCIIYPFCFLFVVFFLLFFIKWPSVLKHPWINGSFDPNSHWNFSSCVSG